ncbi:UDP-glucose dehydrogenase family protein [Cytobacillus dafuensis]|uniref:UDP-glucose 6-dehydrogenase n=1 Tax=Cytobacillus dafuensis TaxID=1742359 RepID=A0A5B8Z043_CYTDA|nr:UDP-glucose/GDP-mannose dehydrogenase family protein [Cytobacillus dafuensis]QED46228.1 UDP-glucose/GDP-mannose dehydrogenase family protein [Cytobacillus dafuensis]
MNILIVGTGYVGTTTGLVFCEMGHQVTGLDIDEQKLKSLQSGKIYFYEPGLDELLSKHLQKRNITFTSDIENAIKDNDIIFICVGTPQGEDGSADLRYVKNVTESIGKYMDKYKVIVNKSTVPVGTAELVTTWIKEKQEALIPFDVVSNPEFLREGSALHDALNPDRIVIGSESKKARDIMKELYKNFHCPIVETDSKSSELIKYAANAFLALKISYINELARLCKTLDIHIDGIAEGIGYDKRIGNSFLKAGIGFGGSCFPKDVSALLYTAKKSNHRLTILEAAKEVNETQPIHFIHMVKSKLGKLKGKNIAILGISFKANTDDTRESPAFRIIDRLLAEQANVTCYDPKAKIGNQRVIQQNNIENTLRNCDAVIICTEWEEFRITEWEKHKSIMKSPVIFDGRNILEKSKMKEIGYEYYNI